MTDNKIIKSLECLMHDNCEDCPYYRDDCVDRIKDTIELSKCALDLINRQQAEIEKLKGSTIVSNIMESQRIKREAKAEAYKEFAERLNEKAQIADCFDSYNMVVGTHSIDNLLKEMVGEKE